MRFIIQFSHPIFLSFFFLLHIVLRAILIWTAGFILSNSFFSEFYFRKLVIKFIQDFTIYYYFKYYYWDFNIFKQKLQFFIVSKQLWQNIFFIIYHIIVYPNRLVQYEDFKSVR